MASTEGGGAAWRLITLLVVGAAAAFFLGRFFMQKDPTDPEVLMQDVAIKCSETGFEWKLNRGRMEQYMYQRAAENKLSLDQGLENPKTGKRTGFPVDREEWTRTVERVLKERAEAAGRQGGSGSNSR